jgi:HK97 family phage prohead protease
MIEYKSSAAEVKSLSDDDTGSVELYAAKFHNIDRANEIIQPGAFRDLDAFCKSGFLAVNHDWTAFGGVGTIEDAKQDDVGLLVRAKFYGTPAAQAVRSVVVDRCARNKACPTSIGYRVIEDEDIKVDGKSVRSLKSITLYETSLVNVPCNPEAGVIGAKSLMTIDELRDLVAEYKAGRVLSAANRAMLARLHQQHSAALADLQSLLDATDPDRITLTEPPAIPPAITDAPKSLLPELIDLNREFLATSARFNR